MLNRRDFIAGLGLVQLASPLRSKAAPAVEVRSSGVEIAEPERWVFPSQTIQLEDDTIVAIIKSANLALYEHRWRGTTYGAKAFNAEVETNGWEGHDVEVNFYFWDDAGKMLHEWAVEHIYVTRSAVSKKAETEIGAVDLIPPALIRRVAFVTYSAGGGSWSPTDDSD